MSDENRSWVCVRCGRSNAPWVRECSCPAVSSTAADVASKSGEQEEEWQGSGGLGEVMEQ